MTVTQQTTWLGLNRRWALPVAIIAAFLFFFVPAFFALLFSFMKSCDAYKDAVAIAKSDPDVAAALGAPLREGFIVLGQVTVHRLWGAHEGSTGDASLEIPIYGPKGKGVIHVEALRSQGKWNFQLLEVEVKATGRNIDLLSKRPRDTGHQEQI